MEPFTLPLDLPIVDFRRRIVESVAANQVTILTAETGAGKSTQVPQYLAEAGYRKVIVTQPRILAARNLSLRVREEWLLRHPEADFTTVAYRTARERDDDGATTILYCTDGLQLVREIAGQGASEEQVLVLDEIHEWNQNMEVLVAWAKKRCHDDPRFKVLVMSATIDADSLAAYFQAATPIEVPGPGYPISIRHAEDLEEEVVRQVGLGDRSILVFLPGKAEIEMLASRLGPLAALASMPIIPLHSQLEAEAQQLAFEAYPHGKLILSTNIAQTSVTIDDIDVVLDSGLERHIEIENGVEGLYIAQASRADCLQRAGRAGRTKPGEYVLASYDRLPCLPLDARPAYAVPEIVRTHLDRLVLRLAGAGIDIEELEFFHAPRMEAIRQAKRTLQTLGALAAKGTITPLGERMERYPVESRYARMLVEAEHHPDQLKLKLAAIIAIQEVGGIIKGGTRLLGWQRYTSQERSDLLAQYDVYAALPLLEPDELEDMGIVPKNATKAAETLHHLCEELGLAESELVPIASSEEELLMRWVITGQIDQIWLIGNDGLAGHLAGGERREISGGSVVPRVGLVSGTPFNLEVPTPIGLQTLYLVQDLTVIHPEWLVAAAPHLYEAKAGAVYFDAVHGCLARRWRLRYAGKEIAGAYVAILDSTPTNRRMFAELLGAWVYDTVERSRLRLQKTSRKRLPAVPKATVIERVGKIVQGAVSLGELNSRQRKALERVADRRSYSDEGRFREPKPPQRGRPKGKGRRR